MINTVILSEDPIVTDGTESANWWWVKENILKSAPMKGKSLCVMNCVVLLGNEGNCITNNCRVSQCLGPNDVTSTMIRGWSGGAMVLITCGAGASN